jgi:hypothetical protein
MNLNAILHKNEEKLDMEEFSKMFCPYKKGVA